MNTTQKLSKKPNFIVRFFWWAAGGDPTLLRKSTHSDRVKYTTLGGIIVATGLMAALAGGYAFYTIFAPKGSAIIEYAINNGYSQDAAIEAANEIKHIPTVLLSIFFGIIWGLIIFNIDRFIVTSTGTGDGTEKITWGEFQSAIPRIIMGSIIAVTISKPVEIRMFQDEINAEIEIAKKEKEDEYISLIEKKYESKISNAKSNRLKLEDEIKQKENRYVQLEDEYIEEARIIKPGPKAKAIKAQADRANMEVNKVKAKNKPLMDSAFAQLSRLENEKNVELASAKEHSESLDGLLIRLKLAHKLAGPLISLFITLLFLAIELTPIFFKLMLIKSPYDYLLENQKELTKANDGIYIEYNYYDEKEHPDKEGIERHLVRFLEKEKINIEKIELLEAQKRLTKYAVEKFEKQQKEEMDKNPNLYIKIEPDQEENA